MKIRTSAKQTELSELSGDIIIPVAQAMAPYSMHPLLQTLTGKKHEAFLNDLDTGKGDVSVAYHGGNRLFFLGMGDKKTFGSWYGVFRNFSRKQGKKLRNDIILCLDLPDCDLTELAEAAVNGLHTGSYESGILKSTHGNGNANANGNGSGTSDKSISGYDGGSVNEDVTGNEAENDNGNDDATGNAKVTGDGNESRNADGSGAGSGAGNEKSNPFGNPENTLTIWSPDADKSGFTEACNHGLIIAETQKRVMELINIPSNRKPPSFLVNWARESGRQFGFEVEVFDIDRIRKEGMLALEAVNRGSEHPAAFIIMRYDPGNSGSEVGLVGKGVIYDTGGLSIKPTTSMQFMKCDMSGAATVMGTMEAAARLQLPVSLIAVIPVTDNLIDSRSVKPGDVIGSYSGKTIEVIDTDAEGRLILADALSWLVKNSNPKHIVDVATLTGDAVRSLGVHAAALFSNDDALAADLTAAGDKCGERLWQLPLWEDYLDELNSDVADLRNLGTKPVGGAITAAKFLEQFIGDHPSWAHLDVAGTAFGDTEFGKQKNATGFGIRLLISFIEDAKQ